MARRHLLLAVLGAALAAPSAGAAAAADPARLVFASARTGVSQLYSLDPSTRSIAQVTFGLHEACHPLPSPDGRWIAWLRPENDRHCGYGELWVARPDGSAPRKVADTARTPAWRPGANRLTWAGRDGILSVRPDGSVLRAVTRRAGDEHPRWSPDGKRLVVSRGADLVVVGGGRSATVASGTRGVGVWSPDGRRLAYAAKETVESVRFDGRLRRVVLRGLLAFPGDGVVGWSHDGRWLALVNGGDGLSVVDARTGAPKAGATTSAPPAWAPDRSTIAYGGHRGDGAFSWTIGGVAERLTPDGYLGVSGLAWAQPPSAGVRWRAPEPVPVVAEAVGGELRALWPIANLAADGRNVLLGLCPRTFALWRPDGVVPTSAERLTPVSCRAVPTAEVAYDPAIAGDWYLYGTARGGNHKDGLLVGGVAGGRATGFASGGGTTGDPWNPGFGYALGDGDALVFSTWRLDLHRRPVEWQIRRVHSVDHAPLIVTTAPGRYEPQALDRGRLAVRTTTGIEIVDLSGRTLLRVDVADVAAATLSGDDLAVLRRGELRHYDARTGALLHTWPLPDVPSGGPCRRLTCDTFARLVLDDAAGGLVAYTLDGTLHLLRLADGRDVAVREVTHVELEPDGLAYAYRADPPYPGRIRFVPFAGLPLR